MLLFDSYLTTISYIFGLYRFEQIAEVVLLASPHLQDLLEVLHGSALHEHLVPLSKLLIWQLHQLDDVFWFGEALIDEGDVVGEVLLVGVCT